MNDARLAELREKYKNRNLLEELGWGTYANHSGYTSKQNGEFLNWLCNAAYRAIKEDKPSGKWIPVSEQLPKTDEYVGNVAKYYLVQNEYGDMLVARYTHSEYWEQIYQLKPVADEIVAWMPLPAPFEPQESEDKE